jgi:predicted metal-dependent hydrolase
MESDDPSLDHDRISVDTEPSIPEPSANPYYGWDAIQSLDALSLVYKNLAEGYGARPGIGQASYIAALEHLEAVIGGLIMQLPLAAPTPTTEEPKDDDLYDDHPDERDNDE